MDSSNKSVEIKDVDEIVFDILKDTEDLNPTPGWLSLLYAEINSLAK